MRTVGHFCGVGVARGVIPPMKFHAVSRLVVDKLAYSLVERIRQRGKAKGCHPNLFVLMDDRIGLRVIATGEYESTHMRALRMLASGKLPGLQIDTSGLAIDVGANIGLYTLALADLFPRVLAFEANPITAKVLEANVALSGRSNVVTIAMGLSDHAGEAKLAVARNGNLGWATLRDVPPEELHQVTHQITALDTLDEVLRQRGLRDERVSLIKLDVEGHETQALKGASEAIARWAPAILFEVNSRDEVEATTTVLRSFGYERFYRFRQTLAGSIVAAPFTTFTRHEALLLATRH